MQRIVRSAILPNKAPTISNSSNIQNESPAFLLALRIKSEQGAQRAAEFLLATEPFLAQGERMHISSRLALPVLKKEAPLQSAPNMPNAGSFNMPDFQAMGNPMQLLNMISGMKGGAGGMDMGMISKLMSIMNKK